MSVDEDFDPPPTGLRRVFRCRHCTRLVHTAEARDPEGVAAILLAHLTFNCRTDPWDSLLCPTG